VAEAAYERLISLPMFPAMTDMDIGDVIKAIRKVMEYYAA
jgi:perosamine synthetase